MKELNNMCENKEEKNNIESFDYKFALEQANHWIESADSKTGVALSLISITFTLYAGFLLENHVFTEETKTKVWIIILSLLSFALFAAAIFFFIKTLIPRITKPVDNKNPFYYGEVSLYQSPIEFVNEYMKPISEEQQRKAVLESIFFNSKIALKKMKMFRRGLFLTALFFLASITCIILVLFTNFPQPV